MKDEEHGFYDQPDVMIEAMDSVRGHRAKHEGNLEDPHDDKIGREVKAGHHWQVAAVEFGTGGKVDDGKDNILAHDLRYLEALNRDMAPRSVDETERILEVMAESKGGRDILAGRGGGADGFRQALDAKIGSTEVEAMLKRVHAKVIEPYKGLSNEEAELEQGMRARGYYLGK